ncbi:MAG: putative lipid II flippase FtsW [Spirochaetes bacterium]|nr:putative lipid II flippase FtsW [Spirochaetota bacterium]
MDLKNVIDTRRKGTPDIIMFFTVFILIGLGIAMSYSASAVFAQKIFSDSFYFLKRQLLWFIVSFAAFILFQQIDYRIYKKYTKVLLLGSLVMLIFLLIPGLGHVAKGSSRWIRVGAFGLQPSEFVKIVLIIYLAKVFSAKKDTSDNPLFQLLIPVIILAIMFLLILLQPDFGTAIDLLFVSVAVLFVSGFSLFYILTLFILSVPAFYLLIYQVDYRRERILAYLNPWQDRYGIGYHIVQAFIAFKKGSVFGAGLGNGTQKISRLPEPHNDFIFAVIAEEAGFAGTVAVIILYCVFFWRGISIALNAPDDFGRLLGTGITLMLVIQAFINIGVVTGSLPTTGIPLPFISYGGSSLLSSMIAAGILLNISRYSDVVHDSDIYNPEFSEVWE